MRYAKEQERDSDFRAHKLDGLLDALWLVAVFQRHQHEADVQQIKSDNQQPVNRRGKLVVADKGVAQERLSVSE